MTLSAAEHERERRQHDDDRMDRLVETVSEVRAVAGVAVSQLADWRAEQGRYVGHQDRRLDDLEADVKDLSAWRWKVVGLGVALVAMPSYTSAIVAIYLATRHH